MEDREKINVEREARARAGDPLRTTLRGQAVNRYLGAFSYVDRRPEPAAPVTATATAARDSR